MTISASKWEAADFWKAQYITIQPGASLVRKEEAIKWYRLDERYVINSLYHSSNVTLCSGDITSAQLPN